MNQTLEESRLKSTIRSLLKERGLKYADMAEVLGVSVVTVRRFMSSDTISIERLVAICEWLGVSFYDLVTISESESEELYNLTVEQEQFLAENEHMFAFLLFLGRGRSADEIAKEYGLSAECKEMYLTELEVAGLLRRLPGNRVQVPYPISERPEGILSRSVFSARSRMMILRAEERMAKNQPTETSFAYTTSLGLTSEHSRAFDQEIRDVIAKYEAMNTIDLAINGYQDLQRKECLIVLDEMDIITEGIKQRGLPPISSQAKIRSQGLQTH